MLVARNMAQDDLNNPHTRASWGGAAKSMSESLAIHTADERAAKPASKPINRKALKSSRRANRRGSSPNFSKSSSSNRSSTVTRDTSISDREIQKSRWLMHLEHRPIRLSGFKSHVPISPRHSSQVTASPSSRQFRASSRSVAKCGTQSE